MSINPQKKDIATLFSIRKPYLIDFYQRDYKWKKEHVKKLLQDLFYRFKLDYKLDSDINDDAISKYDWYYLNTFVTNDYLGDTFLVDGQQRLTTIALILIKLFHLTKKYDDLKNLSRVIEDRIAGSTTTGRDFWIGYGNRREALEDLFEHGKQTRDNLSPTEISIRNIYLNYIIIDNEIDSKLQDAHKLKAFSLYFLSRVMLVQIDIDYTKDVPMIFEVINDRGERLKPYEVLKGKLLGQIAKDEVDDYHDIWQRCIHRIQEVNEEKVDQFFRWYFQAKYAETRAEYREFDEDYHRTIYEPKWDNQIHLKGKPKNVKHFISNDLSYYADLYSRTDEACSDEDSILGPYLFYNDINGQDRQILLIISACMVNDTEEEIKIKLVSRLFDKHYSLLQLMGAYNSNNFTDSLLTLIRKIRNKPCAEIEEIYNNQILEDISKAKLIEVKTPFEWNYFKDASYIHIGDKFIRYFLARIEHFIATNIGKKAADFYDLARNTGPSWGYHIEHILANNEENRKLFDDDEELFRTERNKLGALLLLKGRENLSSGPESYSDKLKTYVGSPWWNQTLLTDFHHSNKDLEDFNRLYDLRFKTYDVYDCVAISERQKILFKLTRAIWS